MSQDKTKTWFFLKKRYICAMDCLIFFEYKDGKKFPEWTMRRCVADTLDDAVKPGKFIEEHQDEFGPWKYPVRFVKARERNVLVSYRASL